MKTVLTLMAMTFASMADVSDNESVNAKASHHFAYQVTDALKSKSVYAYTALIPSLMHFKKVMRENGSLYGGNLDAAQREFAKQYEFGILPAAEDSFQELILEGKRRGIDWDNVSLVSWETKSTVIGDLDPVTFVITIESGAKNYRIEIEKAFYLDGQWKVSQFIKLV